MGGGRPSPASPGPRLLSSCSSSSVFALSCISQTLGSQLSQPAGSTDSSFRGSAGSRNGKGGSSARPAGSTSRLRARGREETRGDAGRARPTHPRMLQHLLDPPVAVSEAAPQPELRGEEDHGARGPACPLRRARAAKPSAEAVAAAERFRVSGRARTSGAKRALSVRRWSGPACCGAPSPAAGCACGAGAPSLQSAAGRAR